MGLLLFSSVLFVNSLQSFTVKPVVLIPPDVVVKTMRLVIGYNPCDVKHILWKEEKIVECWDHRKWRLSNFCVFLVLHLSTYSIWYLLNVV